MAKRLISFRINRGTLEFIKQEADNRHLSLSAVIEERLNPYSDVKV